MDEVRLTAIEIVLELGSVHDVNSLLNDAAKVEAYLRGRPSDLETQEKLELVRVRAAAQGAVDLGTLTRKPK